MISNQQKPLTGLLGGTFDPIHLGHTWIAQSLIESLGLRKVLFMPCHTPVHKSLPKASAEQREAMVQLSLENHPKCALHRFELLQKKPIYTYTTMAELVKEGIKPALILGADAWEDFPTWENGDCILKSGYIIVVYRPGFDWPPSSHEESPLESSITQDLADLEQNDFGKILLKKIDFPENFYDNFSSSNIRQQITLGGQPQGKLDDKVFSYCQKHRIYEENSHDTP